ncbi:MAG: segregation/condensation protein A [Cytophagales bacterium]
MSFEIKLPLFEGPFDLLLFFIERDELDIYDIPIFKITTEFLEYIHHLEKLNMEVASEFIFVASTLMSIKAKMLLPRQELNEAGQEIDPREELVKHLLEYKKYKSVVEDLAILEKQRLDKEARGNIKNELKIIAEQNDLEVEMQDVTLFRMLQVFNKVMSKFSLEVEKPIHQVVQYPYTIEEQKDYIIHLLDLYDSKKLSFVDIISVNSEKIAVIYNFLAVLELLQLNKIQIHIGEGYNNFWLEKNNNYSNDDQNQQSE